MNRIEQRLADALTARAGAVDVSSVHPLPFVRARREPWSGSRRKWLAPVAAAVSITLIAAVAALVSGLAPKASHDRPGAQTATFRGELMDVDALSAADAWTVGMVQVGPTSANKLGREPLIMHWDGSTWRRTAAPANAGGGVLMSVSGSAADGLWAVGYWEKTAKHPQLPFIARWNGKRWQQVHFAGAAKAGMLWNVSVRSATDAWAVGSAGPRGALILHWNGRTWQKLPVARPGRAQLLTNVTAISANDAWAVGINGDANLIMHWNGSAWKVVRGPNPHNRSLNLSSVISTPSGEVWAAGYGPYPKPGVVVIRWDGSAWHKMRGLRVPDSYALDGIAENSPDDIWVSGWGDNSLVLMHWNGANWSRPAGLTRKSNGYLYGLSFTSASDGWVVGNTGAAPLILHWNGTSWKKVFN